MAKLYISMVSVALELGARAFAGKKDKTGREGAFLHSMRVEAAVAKTGAGEVAQAAALLHDVVEDTPVTLDDIRTAFAAYPTEKVDKMIGAIKSVTRGYINRVTREMAFTPPVPEFVCNCKSVKSFKCLNLTEHIYDKETYREFVMRSKRNSLGRIIKIADITDNSTPARVEGLSEDEKGIVEERYVPALAYLKDDKSVEYYTPRQNARLCERCSQPFDKHAEGSRQCPTNSLLFVDPQRNTFKGVR